jgi:hypothetical protein
MQLCEVQPQHSTELYVLQHSWCLQAGLGPLLLPAAEAADTTLMTEGVNVPPGPTPEATALQVLRRATDILWAAAEAAGDECLLAAGYAADVEALTSGLLPHEAAGVRATCGALVTAADAMDSELHGAGVGSTSGRGSMGGNHGALSGAAIAMLGIISRAALVPLGRSAPSTSRPGNKKGSANNSSGGAPPHAPPLLPHLSSAASELDRTMRVPAPLAPYSHVLSCVAGDLGPEHANTLVGPGGSMAALQRPTRAAKSNAMRWIRAGGPLRADPVCWVGGTGCACGWCL